MRAAAFIPLMAFAGCASTAEGEPLSMKADPNHGPLVVELFTSQGCSSCPPADRLAQKLASPSIVPLAFHVDYWNDLGWADPFSLPAWTQRQHDYANALGDNRVYTPELVVGGAAGMVGSQEGAVTKAIANAMRPAVLPVTASWTRDAVKVTATAPADADVFVAVWQDATTTKVERGENAGEALVSDHVVRRFERVAAAGQAGTINVPIDPSWRAGAIAFAQRRDKHIVASALLPR